MIYTNYNYLTKDFTTNGKRERTIVFNHFVGDTIDYTIKVNDLSLTGASASLNALYKDDSIFDFDCVVDSIAKTISFNGELQQTELLAYFEDNDKDYQYFCSNIDILIGTTHTYIPITFYIKNVEVVKPTLNLASEEELSLEIENRENGDIALDTRLDNVEGAVSTLAGDLNTLEGDLSTVGGNLSTHTGLTTTAHGGIVSDTDSRLTNNRTPTAHALSHKTGGTDALTPGDIGAIADNTTYAITYTGTPQIMPVLFVDSRPLTINQSGTNTIINGKTMYDFTINENPSFTNKLTSISFNDIDASILNGFNSLQNMISLQTIALPNIKYCGNNGVALYTLANNGNYSALQSIDLQNLIYAGNNAIYVYYSASSAVFNLEALQTINLNKLVNCVGNAVNIYTAGTGAILSLNALQYISLPELLNCNYPINVGTRTVSLNVLQYIDMPKLQNYNSFYLSGTIAAPLLTYITMPNVIRCIGTIVISSVTALSALSNIVIGTVGVTKQIGGNITITNCALSQTSVDNILILLASLDGTNDTTSYNGKIINLSGGTSATPSATGLAAKAILLARSCTVTHN